MGFPPGSASKRCSTRYEHPQRRPRRTASWKSAFARIRAGAGSITAPRGAAQAESSARPLRRRAERIARPARVRMRSRKPCVLARRRLFGWKVRLLTKGSRCFVGATRGNEVRPAQLAPTTPATTVRPRHARARDSGRGQAPSRYGEPESRVKPETRRWATDRDRAQTGPDRPRQAQGRPPDQANRHTRSHLPSYTERTRSSTLRGARHGEVRRSSTERPTGPSCPQSEGQQAMVFPARSAASPTRRNASRFVRRNAGLAGLDTAGLDGRGRTGATSTVCGQPCGPA